MKKIEKAMLYKNILIFAESLNNNKIFFYGTKYYYG